MIKIEDNPINKNEESKSMYSGKCALAVKKKSRARSNEIISIFGRFKRENIRTHILHKIALESLNLSA